MKIIIKDGQRVATKEVWLLQPVQRHEMIQVVKNLFVRLNEDVFPEGYRCLFDEMSDIDNGDSVLVDMQAHTIQIDRK
jgi:hypothetical protein